MPVLAQSVPCRTLVLAKGRIEHLTTIPPHSEHEKVTIHETYELVDNDLWQILPLTPIFCSAQPKTSSTFSNTKKPAVPLT